MFIHNFKYSLKMLRQSDNVNKLYKRFLFNDKNILDICFSNNPTEHFLIWHFLILKIVKN